MRLDSSYRSGTHAGDQRPQSHRALLVIAVLGMLATGSLGCTSTDQARGIRRNAPPAADPAMPAAPASGSANAVAAGEVEDPQLAAAFARLELARLERERRGIAMLVAARPIQQDGSQHARTPQGGNLQTGEPPANEMLPGARAATIPVWSGTR